MAYGNVILGGARGETPLQHLILVVYFLIMSYPRLRQGPKGETDVWRHWFANDCCFLLIEGLIVCSYGMLTLPGLPPQISESDSTDVTFPFEQGDK